MGWCSGTAIFDPMADFILRSGQDDEEKVKIIVFLIETLENEDWDCQGDSRYYEHYIVRAAFRRVHPDWEELNDATPEGGKQ